MQKVNMNQDLILLAKNVFDIEAQAILALKERLNESFLKAAKIIFDCKGKVVLTGVGKSGQVARKISSTLSSTGTPSIFLHSAETSHGDLGSISSNDVVMAISYGGETNELSSILSYTTRKNIPLIALTGNLKSTLATSAQVVLDVRVAKEACPLGLAPTASSTATLAMGDALAMVVLNLRGFRDEDFAEFHPGGGLGLRLSRVKDHMHSGLAMPVLKQNTPIRQVLGVMSQGNVRGAAGVIDEQGLLIGIITDGDIRRRLENSTDALQGTAHEIMTKNPRTIDANELIEKALFVMEEFRINLLFVLDKTSTQPRHPVGIIHIQDILKSKVK